MPAILGNLIVIAVLGVMVFFAVRSILRKKKSGGCGCGCSGNCPGCGSIKGDSGR